MPEADQLLDKITSGVPAMVRTNDPIEPYRFRAQAMIHVCVTQFSEAMLILLAANTILVRDMRELSPKDKQLKLLERRLEECWQLSRELHR